MGRNGQRIAKRRCPTGDVKSLAATTARRPEPGPSRTSPSPGRPEAEAWVARAGFSPLRPRTIPGRGEASCNRPPTGGLATTWFATARRRAGRFKSRSPVGPDGHVSPRRPARSANAAIRGRWSWVRAGVFGRRRRRRWSDRIRRRRAAGSSRQGHQPSTLQRSGWRRRRTRRLGAQCTTC